MKGFVYVGVAIVFWLQGLRSSEGDTDSSCGQYLSGCCPGNACNSGLVCASDIIVGSNVCYTPRCTSSLDCISYAYCTDCNTVLHNCNACGKLLICLAYP